MLPFVIRAGFDADPGSAAAYSNSNFVLAGLAIEKAAGMSFDAYMAKTIFEPLGMTSTGYPLTTAASLATPLIPEETRWVQAPQPVRGSSAGGSYSTPRDLLRFIRGLLAGKVLRPETVTLMTTSKTARFEQGFEYGYGFEVTRHKQTLSFGHGGHHPRRRLHPAVLPARRPHAHPLRQPRCACLRHPPRKCHAFDHRRTLTVWSAVATA